MSSSPIIVALDYPTEAAALEMARQLNPAQCRVKVGKELFTLAGPQVVESLHHLGFEVFLDLKYHDIPNTTAMAVKEAAKLGVWMVNVHASGGRRMMENCRNELDKIEGKKPLLIGVTVLTSMEQQDLIEIGITATPEEHVLRLARLGQAAGLDGVVCSALEATALRRELGDQFALVTPGIRPASADSGDQRRIMTPRQAVEAGSTYLVIGRPITQAEVPAEAAAEILATLEG